jgi:hypothetical protein
MFAAWGKSWGKSWGNSWGKAVYETGIVHKVSIFSPAIIKIQQLKDEIDFIIIETNRINRVQTIEYLNFKNISLDAIKDNRVSLVNNNGNVIPISITTNANSWNVRKLDSRIAKVYLETNSEINNIELANTTIKKITKSI